MSKFISPVANAETMQAKMDGMPCSELTPQVSCIPVFACKSGPMCENPYADKSPAIHPTINAWTG